MPRQTGPLSCIYGWGSGSWPSTRSRRRLPGISARHSSRALLPVPYMAWPRTIGRSFSFMKALLAMRRPHSATCSIPRPLFGVSVAICAPSGTVMLALAPVITRNMQPWVFPSHPAWTRCAAPQDWQPACAPSACLMINELFFPPAGSPGKAAPFKTFWTPVRRWELPRMRSLQTIKG